MPCYMLAGLSAETKIERKKKRKHFCMGEFSKISWTDHTFNAWIGCTKVSPGCKFCYAEEFANKYNFAKWGTAPRYLTADSTWAKPLAWNKRAEKEKIRYRVFCSSLSDVME